MESKKSRLFLMCTSRSGSTSLLKCLSFVEGAELWFEPFVIARIARKEFKMHTGQELPTDWAEARADDFDKASLYVQDVNKLPLIDGRNYAYSEIKRSIDNASNHTVIVKDMGNSFYGCLQYLPSVESGFKYVFVIRDPYLVLSSYRRASYGAWKKFGSFDEARDEKDFDLFTDDRYYRSPGGGFRNQHMVWKHVRENLDPDPLVIDFEDFLSDPESYLRKICEVADIEFDEGLLEWDSSPHVSTTWKNPAGIQQLFFNALSDFHHTAITSSCFMTRTSRKERPARSSLSPDVLRAADEGIEAYQEMYEHRFLPR